MTAPPPPTGTVAARLRPWHFILAFGIVSLLADMVYEGARSIIGPYLATLGASAALVGVVAGAGEFIGYGLRVVTGYATVRTRHYWTWTIVGYALTVLSVPLIGVTGMLAPALLLYGTERLGKAVRSPAKDTLLSYASASTGRGSAFGVHQALDQTGAVLGPLLLAAVLGWRDGDYALAFGVLIVPGALVLALLLWLRHRVPDPLFYEQPERASTAPAERADTAGAPGDVVTSTPSGRPPLPGRFWFYVAVVAVLSIGTASFPLLAFHAQSHGLLPDALVPILFAVAMLVDGASGLVVGRAYDRFGARVLLLIPVAALASAIAFTDDVALLWIGVAVWGLVSGVLDSTVKAVVTELVSSGSRAIAFGWLAFARGFGLLLAGAALGFAYDRGAVWLVIAMVAANVLGFAGLLVVLRRMASPAAAARGR
ncbi:MFS transporter [Microbacterium sp.]|uniref:MFS transporter n=1 Tax=Microbacterium sp. TaxID=51671 RepID=UPI001AD201EB|nr:MFS transporter [Microbacterium sp.]MBN9157489.1 MFS transporter [Microbacterium sp.]MBS1899333.1 MFS transporter [Actinomycetota bacterium]